MGERRSGRSSADPSVFTRHFLGLAVLLLAVGPAYLTARLYGPRTVSAAVPAADISEPAAEAASQAKLLEIEAHIREVAARYDVSPRLVAAVIEAESEFNPRAVSRKGARGLMQLMPETASSLQVEDSFDPFENIEGGVRHLRRLIDRFNGNLPYALAAYNAGEQAVVIHGGIPPYRETRRYVARILRQIGYTAPAEASRPAIVPSEGPRPAVLRTTTVAAPTAAPRPDIRPAVLPEPMPAGVRENASVGALRAFDVKTFDNG